MMVEEADCQHGHSRRWNSPSGDRQALDYVPDGAKGLEQGQGALRRGRPLKGEVRPPKTNFTRHFTRGCPPYPQRQSKPKDNPRTKDCSIFIYSLVQYLLRLNIYSAPNKLLALRQVVRGTDNVSKLTAQCQAHWKDHELQRATYLSLNLRLRDRGPRP